ncbi:tetratricopeptide repeat protein [Neisseria sp. 74A18]|uniref:tetratricopeptide repeat protein n=1 Tax=Neisseria sp. 74A18 TaxID=1696094 RepID=UPI002101CE69|nr:tetratricopeptide repeat protein [Neisseria sp. 74A18]
MAYFYGKGVEQNTGKAIELTNKAIEGGSKEALYNLSRMYLSINKEDEAAAMLRQAANIGIPKAQAELASLLSKVAKTNAEKIEAKQWLEKALIQEDPYAYAVAGLLYSQKNQVFPYDEAKAFEYLMKASDMGEETLKHMIGAWYWTGKYVSKDEKNALKWIEDAANHGDIKAVERLVRIYEKAVRKFPKTKLKHDIGRTNLALNKFRAAPDN